MPRHKIVFSDFLTRLISLISVNDRGSARCDITVVRLGGEVLILTPVSTGASPAGRYPTRPRNSGLVRASLTCPCESEPVLSEVAGTSL